MAKLVSKTYGDALFELALEEEKIDVFQDEILFANDVFNENKELQTLMNHPKVNKEEKKEVIKNIFTGKVSDDTVGFLLIIVEKGRFGEIDAIFDYFLEKVREYKNIGRAFIQTAVELNDSQKENVKNRLLETTRYEKMEIEYFVEPALIGGMIIRIGDRVVDSSIQTKLYEMKKDLSRIQLKNV